MPVTAKEQTEIAAALVRLYVFLTHYLDRCADDSAGTSGPDSDLQAHLDDTRRRLTDILSVNPVVGKKVTEECDRILSLGAACRRSGGAAEAARTAVHDERAALRHKTIALSDLVAVYRALD